MRLGRWDQITKDFISSAVGWDFILRAVEARGEWKNISSCSGPFKWGCSVGTLLFFRTRVVASAVKWTRATLSVGNLLGQKQTSMEARWLAQGALWQLCKEDESLIIERKVYLGQSEQQGSWRKWVKLTLTSTPASRPHQVIKQNQPGDSCCCENPPGKELTVNLISVSFVICHLRKWIPCCRTQRKVI